MILSSDCLSLKIEKSVKFIKICIDNQNQGGKCIPYGSYFIIGRLYWPGIGWTGRSRQGQAVKKAEKKENEGRGMALYESD